MTGVRSYAEVKKETAQLKRHSIEVYFLGVWDTVVAYGLMCQHFSGHGISLVFSACS
jgi:hypothetical protein